MKHIITAIKALSTLPSRVREGSDDVKMLQGRLLAETLVRKRDYESLADFEFKVFSQFGDDGIIQFLTHNLKLSRKTFIEFGVENYLESNTRFLLQKDNWSGFVMDGSKRNIDELKLSQFFWKHDLMAQSAFVTKENINKLLTDVAESWGGVDLLHIDIDGNDYWIWEAISLFPAIAIIEYNSSFGIDRAITIPYEPHFYRTTAHFSNLYWGSSLKALYILAQRKGYVFIGCNSAGNNAYFVRRDSMNESVKEASLEANYVVSKYRESRDEKGNLTFASGKERAEIIRGMPVFDVELGRVVPF